MAVARKLEGRVALVTGAGRMRGIGRATALRLAAEGASVVVSAGPREPASFPEDEQKIGWKGAQSVVDEILGHGGRAVAIPCDVTDASSVATLFDEAVKALGAPDAIVNNAGTAGGAGNAPIIDLSEGDWNRTIAVNLNGVFLVCRAAAQSLRAARKPGAIVNIGSLASRSGFANYGGYCASKFAVVGLTQQLALELTKHKIRVNAVCPGSIDTDMMDATFHREADRSGRVQFADVKTAVARTIPMRRQGRPEEQAAAIAFLLGEDASYITGQTINVDGGFRMD